jgi:hypothetical protein
MFSYKQVVLSYQYFYSKKYGNKDYIFIPSEKAAKQINQFLKTTEDEHRKTVLGINFLWNYFVFQFNYWSNIEIEERDFTNRIVISYIVGSKAWERYKDRNQEYDWTIYNSQLDINKGEYTRLVNPQEVQELDQKSIKKRHFNTERGFNNCLVFTTLYNHRDLICLNCIYKADCKKILSKTYPKIYAKRGYDRET